MYSNTKDNDIIVVIPVEQTIKVQYTRFFTEEDVSVQGGVTALSLICKNRQDSAYYRYG